MTALLVLQAFASCALAGLIWFVQIVHYPLMGAVGPAEFVEYERRHRRRVSAVVVPLMAAELVCALWLLGEVASTSHWIGVGLVGLLWLLTLLVAAPLHAALSTGFDTGLLERLLRVNAARTLLWTLRSALALWMLAAS